MNSLGGQVAASQGNKGSEGSVMDVLEQTLWNRSLGAMSEEIVAALVCQIFEGARLVFVCGARCHLKARATLALSA